VATGKAAQGKAPKAPAPATATAPAGSPIERRKPRRTAGAERRGLRQSDGTKRRSWSPKNT